jgi:CheY-like chemotaxis protein
MNRYNTHRTILLVDDNDLDNHVNTKIIKRCNFADSIHSVNSAKSAIKFLNGLITNPEKLPDLIFLDIVMPEVDGFGFLRMFYKCDEVIKSKCRIVMLTSSVDSIDYYRALSYPYVINYLKKPLNIEELFAIAA